MKIFFVIYLISLITNSQDGRLDPHGKPDTDLKKAMTASQSSCLACHFDNARLRANPENTCSNCHNKSPHSGVTEHMGRSWNSSKINCLSCHAAHRKDSKSAPVADFFKNPIPKMGADFGFHPKPEAMLKRTCTECHKW